MVTLESFKKFARLFVPPTPAVPSEGASGIIVLTKDNNDDAINVPSGSEFSTDSGITFRTNEEFNISESQAFLPIAVKATGTGSATNIEANQTWNSPISDISVSNPAEFSGGSDGTPADPGIPSPNQLTDMIEYSDSVLQANIDLGVLYVRRKMGLETKDPLPDNVSVDRAIHLYASFFTENYSSQQRVTAFKAGDFSMEKTEYFRSAVWIALDRQVNSLLGPYRKNWRFIPPYKDPKMEASA